MDADSSVDTPLAEAVLDDLSSSSAGIRTFEKPSDSTDLRMESGSRAAADPLADRLRHTAERLRAVLRPKIDRPVVSLLESIEMPCVFGRFQLQHRLGGGGFGVVFLADDPHLGRPVAIKIPHLELLRSQDVGSRFVREAQALAQLNHPHIVSVHEAGEIDESPYLVLEYYNAGTLTEFVAAQRDRLSPRACAELVLSLARAIGHAHQLGLLHRDIKPRNVLLTKRDTPPIARRQATDSIADLALSALTPKLTDFGLAKWLDATDDPTQTKTGAMVGTPQYMAPEQTRRDASAVGPATDVHGLGLILYELLTGRAPFLGDSLPDTLRNIQTVEPLSIRKQRPSVPRDLETICFKALAKEPNARYANGRELAEDLQRFLDGQPIVARPISSVERWGKWCRRRPELAMLWFVVVAALLIVTSGGWWFSVRLSDSLQSESNLRRQENKLRQNESKMLRESELREAALKQRTMELQRAVDDRLRSEYAAGMQIAQELYETNRLPEARRILNRLRPEDTRTTDFRGFDWYLLLQLCGGEVKPLGDRLTNYTAVSIVPSGSELIAGDDQGKFWRWDARSLQPLAEPAIRKTDRIHDLQILPNDRWLFTTCRPPHPSNSSLLILWDRKSNQESVLGRSVLWQPIVATPNGKFAAAWSKSIGPKIFDLSARKFLRTVTWGTCPEADMAASPDGQEYAFCHAQGVFFFSTKGAALKDRSQAKQEKYERVAYSPNGEQLALMDENGRVVLWRRTEKQPWQNDRELALDPESFLTQGGAFHNPMDVEFSPSSQHLAISRPGGSVEIWDLWSDKLVAKCDPFDRTFRRLRFLPDWRRLLMMTNSGQLHVWNTPVGQPQPAGHAVEAWCVAFSPDGKWLASGSDDHTIRFWEVASGREVAVCNGHVATVSQIRFSPDGSQLASISLDGTLRVWKVSDGTEVRYAQAHKKGRAVDWSADGRHIVTAGYADEGAIVWSATTLDQIRLLPGHSATIRAARFSKDGRWIATVSNDRTLRITPRDSDVPFQVWGEQNEIHSALFLDDGQTIALGQKHGQITLRDVETGAVLHSLAGHYGHVKALALTFDRQVLASGDETGQLRFWSPHNGHLLLSLQASQHPINGLAFSPDGTLLATATHDGQVKLWHAPRD